jgi:hypothetical protein
VRVEALTVDAAAALAAYEEHGSHERAAKALAMRKSSYRELLRQARGEERGFSVVTPPSPDEPLPELLQRLRASYARKRAHADATRLVQVNVNIEGPIGLLIFGDPHLGSPLTNWTKLLRDMDLVKNTPGLFGVNLGDVGDNWAGKLAHLWADNEMSHRTEQRLVRWFLRDIDWLLWLRGNHCFWTGPGDPTPWLAEQEDVIAADWSQRIELVFPRGRPCRIGAYHGARGSSMWNSVHGAVKQIRLGARDHLVVAGHTHRGQMLGPIEDDNTGEWSWALNVGSYKDLADGFSKRIGGEGQNAYPSALVIIDPEAPAEEDFIRLRFPVAGAAELTWLREQHAHGRHKELAA